MAAGPSCGWGYLQQAHRRASLEVAGSVAKTLWGHLPSANNPTQGPRRSLIYSFYSMVSAAHGVCFLCFARWRNHCEVPVPNDFVEAFAGAAAFPNAYRAVPKPDFIRV